MKQLNTQPTGEIVTRETLTYRDEETGSLFTKELEYRSDLRCEDCVNNDGCLVDGQLPGVPDGCPLMMTNLISRTTHDDTL